VGYLSNLSSTHGLIQGWHSQDLVRQTDLAFTTSRSVFFLDLTPLLGKNNNVKEFFDFFQFQGVLYFSLGFCFLNFELSDSCSPILPRDLREQH
jgi:hypothetical protein